MNKEELNMDKLFREKMEGFSQLPPSHVWDNIREQLLLQKRKRRIVFFRSVAAAAAIFLVFLAGWYFTGKTPEIIPQTVENGVVEKQMGTENQPGLEPESIKSIQINTSGEINLSEKQVNTSRIEKTGKTGETVGAGELKPFERIRIAFMESKKAEFDDVDYYAELLTGEISGGGFTDEDRLRIEENLKAMETKGADFSKWKMGLYVSPGYSSQSVSYSETYSNNMVYSENDGAGNVTGGFSVQYKTGKKVSVETGVYYEKNGKSSVDMRNLFSKNYEYANSPQFDAGGVYISDAVNAVNGNLLMNSVAGVIEFSSTPAGAEYLANLDGTSYSSSNALLAGGEYSQVFEFVEVPFHLRYSVFSSDLGVELIGGVNTAFVTGNSVYFDNGDYSQNVGRTKDISKINFSGTVGVGINYALGKHFSLAVEPRFNYYLNSINKNPDINFKPYRIGVYTGLYYHF